VKRSIILAALALAACRRSSPPYPAPIPAVSGDRGAINLTVPYTDFVKGTGKAFTPRSCIYVHYTGWLTDGKKFDSSRDPAANGQPKPPLSFPQGYRRVIAGWDNGFDGMRVGGQRRLIIPPVLGYGVAGSGATIPPNATLIFDVELMAVADTMPRPAPPPPPAGGAGRGGGAQVPACAPWDSVKTKG
jgi:hypothetical protein